MEALTGQNRRWFATRAIPGACALVCLFGLSTPAFGQDPEMACIQRCPLVPDTMGTRKPDPACVKRCLLTGGGPERAASAVERLRTFSSSGGHQFWRDALSLQDDLFDLARAGSRQLTDVYLLGLAVNRKGRLATFDRSVPLAAVRGAGPGSIALVG